MKKYPLLLIGLISMIGFFCSAKKVISVVDALDNSPVVKAAVFSSKGTIIGFTDTSGKMEISDCDYPISFHSLGYDSRDLFAYQDTVKMTPASYTLAEVVVTPGETPITRVLAYVREYANVRFNTDTILIYQQFMVEYFYAEGKVKGYKESDREGKIRNAVSYSEYVNDEGRDTIRRHEGRDIYGVFVPKVPDYAILHFGKNVETQKLIDGAANDEIPGKYSPEYTLKKQNSRYSIRWDRLSRYEDHKWINPFAKFLGFYSDMNVSEIEINYRINDRAEYDIYDLIGTSYRERVTISGKPKIGKNKEQFDAVIDGFIETYPVLIENITIPEYKEMRKARKTEKIEFREPLHLPPFPPAIERLKTRAAQTFRE